MILDIHNRNDVVPMGWGESSVSRLRNVVRLSLMIEEEMKGLLEASLTDKDLARMLKPFAYDMLPGLAKAQHSIDVLIMEISTHDFDGTESD